MWKVQAWSPQCCGITTTTIDRVLSHKLNHMNDRSTHLDQEKRDEAYPHTVLLGLKHGLDYRLDCIVRRSAYFSTCRCIEQDMTIGKGTASLRLINRYWNSCPVKKYCGFFCFSWISLEGHIFYNSKVIDFTTVSKNPTDCLEIVIGNQSPFRTC